METIFESDTIKIEKEKAMRRYKTFRKIANFVRTLEIFLGITLISISISSISSYIPTVLEYSGGILRRLTSLLFSPHFVFVIGNVIIITLFAKSSPSSDENSGEFSPEISDVATEVPMVEKVYRRSQSESQSTALVKVEEVVEKKELRRSTTVPRRKLGSDDVAAKAVAKAVEEKRRRKSCEEDDLSNDEFNRRVEEFIEKQRRFLNEERKILVLSN